MAVSIFSTLRTSSSIFVREPLSSSAMRAPVPAALPAEATCGQIAVRNHPEQHRVLDVDVTAERAGQPDPIDVIGSHVLHQQLDTRVQRRLRELNGTHIVLGDL